MEFIDDFHIMNNASKAILQCPLTPCTTPSTNHPRELELETLLYILPRVSKCIAEKAHGYTKSHWHLC
ncbi:hypothetical protein N7453_008667 [Penicillium expansum]|nr:hypothetical protein N7453_008667 [Penicillium expansum]